MDVTQQAETALRIVREAKEVTYDTEGSGLDWKRNFPIGYVIGSSPQDVVYVPVRHGGGGNLPGAQVPTSPQDDYQPHPFEVTLGKAFDERNSRPGMGKVIGHHIKFDCHMSANVGVMLGRNLSCTQNNQALLNEYSRSFSLENVAKEHKVTAKRGQEMYDHLARSFECPPDRKSMQHFWRTAGNDPIAVDYAVGDGVTTLELYNKQLPMLVEQELQQVKALEDDLIWTLFRMERRGIKVNEEYVQVLLRYIEEQTSGAIAALPDGFNIRSPKDMREYVTAAGHTDWPTTDKGNPSFKEQWLKTFPEGERIVMVRKWTNIRNTFMLPLIEQHVWMGRVHCQLNQLKADDYGTVAGRLSCSDPNLQAAPKRDKELAYRVRKAYEADEGMVFYDADYGQCEPRLFGHYSKEPAILNGYNANPPLDMHYVVARLLDVERDPTAKRMNMGILTGMYPKSFAGHMGWPIDQATEKWNQWFEAFPGIRDFQDKAKKVLRSRGFVRTLLGRKCRLENPRFAYRAVSKIIQGGNADVLKWFMLKLDQYCEGTGDVAQLLLTIHDSFQWQVPDSPEGKRMSEEMKAMMCRVQEPPFNLRVPFTVDSGSGPNWAIATFGEKAEYE